MQDVPAKAMDRRRAALVRMLGLAAGVVLAVATAAAAPASRTPDAESQAQYVQLCGRLDAAYDSLRGGWVVKGQPIEAAIELGLIRGAEGDTLARGRALRTLEWMRALVDSVGGGYYTNAQSADPYHTAFEKLTWPNSRRLELLVHAWRATGDERWKRDAGFVQDYMDRVLLDGRGGFVSGQVGDRTLLPEANGEAVAAWLAWGSVTRHPRYRDFAWKSLDRLWAENHDEKFGIVARTEFGTVAAYPRLADHVELGLALLASHAATGRAADLARARELGDVVLGRFELAGRGFREAYELKKSGQPKRPSFDAFENARAATFFAQLAAVTGDTRWSDAARRAHRAFAGELEKGKDARAVAEWAMAVRARWAPALPAVVAWEAAPSAPKLRKPRR